MPGDFELQFASQRPLKHDLQSDACEHVRKQLFKAGVREDKPKFKHCPHPGHIPIVELNTNYTERNLDRLGCWEKWVCLL